MTKSKSKSKSKSQSKSKSSKSKPAKSDAYSLKSAAGGASWSAPELKYQPPRPRRYNPPIGLIGCGGISKSHLTAYRDIGLNVVALCDLIPDRAEGRRKEFFPEARTYTDYKQLLGRDDIEVVDIATHPQDREYLIPDAIEAGKHVLSQKPFVLNLDTGERFAELADKKNVKLAINQNGRWAPYVSYIRHAVAMGLLGETFAAHLACHWNHEWIGTTHFNRVHHIVLYDFPIHWFDMLSAYLPGRKPLRAMATLTRAAHQKVRPPLLGQVLIEFDGAQASLQFDAATRFGPIETAYVAGPKGTISGQGPVCGISQLDFATAKGRAPVNLEGKWFTGGMEGSMGELLCAIESRRVPNNNAHDNLRGLSMCFAAVVSAETGRPQTIGKVRKVPLATCQVAPA